MKKNFLLSFLMATVGAFTANAAECVFTENIAGNVQATYAGNPITFDASGTTTIDVTEEGLAAGEIVISALPGANLESVKYYVAAWGDSFGIDWYYSAQNPEFHFGYSSRYGLPTKFEITTSGKAIADGQVAVTFNVGNNPSSFTITGPDGAVEPGTPSTVDEGTTFTIKPHIGYAFDKITDLAGQEVAVTTDADGNIVFKADATGTYSVYTKLTADAIKFTVDVDCALNVTASLNYIMGMFGQAGNPQALSFKNGVNEIVGSSDNKVGQPIVFFAQDGARIASITKNGEPLEMTEMGWSYYYEEGDVFVVKTIGKPVDVTFQTATTRDAPLDLYSFTDENGVVYHLDRGQNKLTMPQGAFITVAGNPNVGSFTVYTNGSAQDMSWRKFTVMADDVVTISGVVNSTDVAFNVADASRVKATQENGRGDALTLSNGVTKFALSQLKNGIHIDAVEGSEITSVEVNGAPIQESTAGGYTFDVYESYYVQINARKAPGEVTLNFALPQDMTLADFTATVDGEEIALEEGMKVMSYSVMTIKPALGFEITSIAASSSDYLIQAQEDGSYTVIVGSEADQATLSIAGGEIQAEEGKAIVMVNGSSTIVRFYLCDENGAYLRHPKDEEGNEPIIQLSADEVNQVPLGSIVEIYVASSMYQFSSVTVNGVAQTLPEGTGLASRKMRVTIDGRTDIVALAYQMLEVSCIPSLYNEMNIKSGSVYIQLENGDKVLSKSAHEGDVITLTNVPTVGFDFLGYSKLIYTSDASVDPWTGDIISGGYKLIPLEGNTYTITAEDVESGFISFQGTFQRNDTKIFKVICGNAFLYDNNMQLVLNHESAGEVIAKINVEVEGSDPVQQVVAAEGDELNLVCYVMQGFHLYSFAVNPATLSSCFPGSVYKVNAKDSYGSENIIMLSGIILQDPVKVETDVYLRGDMNGWEANDDYKFETVDGITFTLNTTIEKGEAFKIADNSWGNLDYGYPEIIALNKTDNWDYKADNASLDFDFDGTIEVTFHAAIMATELGAGSVAKVTFIGENGIEGVEADAAEAEYFNLQGVRVENPESGIYIKRQGTKVTKVLVK